MAKPTKLSRLGARIISASSKGQVEKLAQLVEEFNREMLRTECPRCNSYVDSLTPEPVSVGVLVMRVCSVCLIELNARTRGSTPIYTQR